MKIPPKATAKGTIPTINIQGNKLTINRMVRLFIARQYSKEADSFIIIYGQPRTGKTSLGFKLLITYLMFMRRLYRAGKSTWNPEKSWKRQFKKYFGTSAGDMDRKIKENPERSYTFVDEGIDVVSWHHALEGEQKDLIDLIQKTGKKKQLTILIVPSLSLLTKSILSRARYMFMLVREPTKGEGNYALVLRQSNNPIIAERNPFGLNKIFKALDKYPSIEANFESFIKSRKQYVGRVWFGPIKPNLYNLYDVCIKNPSIMKERERRTMISASRFKALKYALENIVYNLKTKDDKSVRQIKALLTDKFGTELVSESVIRNYIDRIMIMEKRPADSVDDEFIDKALDVDAVEDVEMPEDLDDEEKYDAP